MSIVPLLFTSVRFSDDRGWFSETYNAKKAELQGLDVTFVQDNHSYSKFTHTIRGLHFQAPPFAQGKLIRVVRGRILDVAVDIRKGSPTYGEWISVELSAENQQQLYIPIGYAHGFATLGPDCEVCYKTTNFYDKASEGGIIWNDPDVSIEWKLSGAVPKLSTKDSVLQNLAALESPFEYTGRPIDLIIV